MEYSPLQNFHILANNILTRDRSLLDVMTKLQDSCSKVNRTISKAVTQCGCLTLHAKKQDFPVGSEYSQLSYYADDHTQGELCPRCRGFVEQAIGDNLFYLTSICNIFNISLEDIIQKELGQLTILGKYNLK